MSARDVTPGPGVAANADDVAVPADAMHALDVDGIRLVPLVPDDAPAMFAILQDPSLYRYLDERPPVSVEMLRERYAWLATRRSPDGRETWLNWTIRPRGGDPVGFVQATVQPDGDAWIGFVVAAHAQGHGYASGSTRAVLADLAQSHGVRRVLASVEHGNVRSIRLLERLGFERASAAEHEGRDRSASERLYRRDLAP